VFIDRLLATLVHLRHGVTHDLLACWFGVSRSTITRAVGEVRPLLAERGCTVEDGIRLRTLADVVAETACARRSPRASGWSPARRSPSSRFGPRKYDAPFTCSDPLTLKYLDEDRADGGSDRACKC
jgi:hypothetical protein